MSYHVWGDNWFEEHGDDLYRAQDYMRRFVKTWSRCNLMTKEKYGTIRYEFVFPPGGAIGPRRFDLFLSNLFGKTKRTFNFHGESFIHTVPRLRWQGSWLYNIWALFGKFVVKMAVSRAIKKWPNVQDEILEDFEEGMFL